MHEYKCAKDECELTSLKGSHFCWNHADPHERRREPHRALPETTQTELDPEFKYESPAEEIERLLKENLELKQEAGKWRTKYEHLQIVYNKLADQWNAFQALAKPDNRNIQRAEGAGEMARKLAEVLLGVAYSTDVRDLLRKFLDDMEGAGGREVEVSEKMVPRY